MLASSLTCAVVAFSGETRSTKSCVGLPSSDSNSTPVSDTPQAAAMRSAERAFPCGMAAPGNRPVDIMASRRMTRSRISPWLAKP